MTTLRATLVLLLVALLASCTGATTASTSECSQLSAAVTAGDVWAASPPDREVDARAEYHKQLTALEELNLGPQYDRHVAALADTAIASPWHTEGIDKMTLPDAYQLGSIRADQVFIAGEFDRQCS